MEVAYKTLDWLPGYRIGSDGSVWSQWNGRYGMWNNWRRLRPSYSGPGYPHVSLRISHDKQKQFHVHRLVLEAFVGKCPEGHEACHNNGDRRDCRLSNLRWDTRSNNNMDKLTHGTMRYGNTSPVRKLSQSDVDEIRRRVASGETQKSVARDFAVLRNTISRIVNGKRWRHSHANR